MSTLESRPFQIGDRVEITYEGRYLGRKGNLTGISGGGTYYVRLDDGEETSWSFTSFKLIKSNNMAETKLNPLAKKLLDKDTQTLLKAGFLNDKLELTDEGADALNSIEFQEFKEKLLALAVEKLDEEKKCKKKEQE